MELVMANKIRIQFTNGELFELLAALYAMGNSTDAPDIMDSLFDGDEEGRRDCERAMKKMLNAYVKIKNSKPGA
jgi:hypothetical protein